MYLYLIFIFAFLIRLINLNQSLWLDEAIVAKVMKTIPLFQIPFQFSPQDFHPPLYYMFMSLWGNIVGYSEITLRFPSIFFSLLTGWYVFKIASLMKDKKTGLWAAAFFLFNPLIIYYSQEARMYMMATMFLTGALFHFVKLSLQAPRSNPIKIAAATAWPRNDIVFFNLFSILAIVTFYGSVFFIGGMLVTSLFIIPIPTKGRTIFVGTIVQLSIGLCFSLLLLSPLLLQQLHNAKMGISEVKNWSMVLGNAELKNVVMIFLKFATGRLSWYPKWSYYLISGISTAIVWLFVVLGMKKNKLFASLFILPLVFGLFISLWTPMMMYFRFLYLIPVMSILLADAVIPVETGIHKKGIFLGWIPAMTIIFSLIYVCNPQFHREDWKKMVRSIDSTKPVYMILPSSDPVDYYNSTLSLFELRDVARLTLPEYIQVIPYVAEIYGYDYVKSLEKKECIRETRSEYRGPLILEEWKCPSSFIGHADVSPIREKN